MSAYGTKKRGADVAQQLTFPAVFSEVVAESANPYGYLPQSQRNPVIMPEGNDLQDKYHQQKKMDADRRVMNAVMDNRASTARFLRSHENYDFPRPVLSQRQYANPSNGNQADIYNNRAIDWNQNTESLMGGVLYTQEAQKWGRQKLRDRIPQLDAIKLAKQAFLTGVPLGTVDRGEPADVFPIGSTVELMAILQSLASAIQMANITPLTMAETLKFLRLLFRWATSASQDELEEVLEVVDDTIVNLQAIEDEFAEGVAEGNEEVKGYSNQLLRTMRKIRDYLVKMVGVVTRSPKERKSASANFIKNAGFTAISRLSAEAVTREIQEALASAKRLDARRNDEMLRDELGDFSFVFDRAPEFSEDQREVKAEEASSSLSTNYMRDGMRPNEMPVDDEDEDEGPAQPAVTETQRQVAQRLMNDYMDADGEYRGLTVAILQREAPKLGITIRVPNSRSKKGVGVLRGEVADRIAELLTE